MKRKLTAFLTVLLLLPVLLLDTCAVNEKGLPLICDGADLLEAEEEANLEAAAEGLLETYGMDVVILTVESLDGQRPQDYADDFFDHAGYGAGEDRSGALLLLSMEERDWYISTSGDGIYALTDYGIQASMEIPLMYLGEGMYYAGFLAWLEELPAWFDAFQEGAPIDGYADYSEDYYHGDQEDVVYYEEEVTPSIFLSLLLGLAVGGIAIFVMRLSMNTREPRHSAGDYLKPGSFDLRGQQDIFLYSQITKREKPKTPPPSSGGGGSSVHMSSSGRSHGGGGGKF